MNSPILELEPYIRSAANTVAPERQHELVDVIAAKALHLELTDEIREISIHPPTGRVRLGLSSLEHLWSAALFYYCLYSDYANAQRSGLSKFDTAQHARTNTAMDLLNWATNQWRSGIRGGWLSALRPSSNPPELSDSHVANELFMAALAWTVHHEYAHARLNHPARELVNAALEEKDADLAATDWIFEKAPSARHLRKRALGVVVAILALDVLEHAQNDPPATSHPRAYERLSYCMNRYAEAEDDEAFAFALCGMQFNLQQRGVVSSLDGPTFRSLLDDCFLARATRIRGES